MPLQSTLIEIPAQTGTALFVPRDRVLSIVDQYGEQVTDVALFPAAGRRDSFSAGRTIDYNQRLRLLPGDTLFSNLSVPLAVVAEDTVGVHDFLLSPCSEEMFARRGEPNHPSCFANLCRALTRFAIAPEALRCTINVFMDVRIDGTGEVTIHPPRSKPGDRFAVRALCDLVVGIAACSSELTNNGACKATFYHVS